MTASWPCRLSWVTNRSLSDTRSASSCPNWKYLISVYGDQEVTVADCNTREFSDQQRRCMTLTEALQAIEESSSTPGHSTTSLYVKDWHLVLQSKDLDQADDRQPYKTPEIFMDDCVYSPSNFGALGT